MKKSRLIEKLLQFIKFGIVGASNTLIYLIVYYILILLKANYLFASVCAYIVSSLSGYTLNKVWVFRENKASLKNSIFKYYVVYSSAMVLNLILMYLFVDIMGISNKLAPLLTLFIMVPYNFVFSKLWIFKEKAIHE